MEVSCHHTLSLSTNFPKFFSTMSATGLLTSIPFHNTAFLNLFPCKLNLVPNFKAEAIATHNVGLKDLPHRKNCILSRIQHANDFVNSNHQAVEDEVVEFFALLNQINKNSGGTNNISSTCKQVHGHLVKVGALKADAFIGNMLVVAYSKSLELLNDAIRLFDEIPRRTVSAHAALIRSFCRSEKWVDLFLALGMMINDGMLPDRYLIPTILKASSVMGVENIGKMVHGYAIRRGLDEDVVVGNALIDMYTNCGGLRLSKIVFDTMNSRDVVSWTALIVAYMVHGLLDKAMDIFCKMELEGVEADLISWNALVSGLAMNGEIEMAHRSLEEMQRKGVRPEENTWNGIISGCIQNGFYGDALDAFVKMFRTSLIPNVVTVSSILPACASLKDLNLGKAIHGYVIKLGLHGNSHIDGSLIGMYWKNGRIDDAENIFVRIMHKSTFVCNEMVAAYMSDGNVEPAQSLFVSMKDSGPKPDVITYNTMLAACFGHGRIENIFKLLYEMTEMGLLPNVVTFNILVSGYQQAGMSHEALRFFQAMQSPHSGSFLPQIMENSIEPNTVTVTGALAACANLGSWRHGKELHAYIVRKGLDSNIFVSSALVDMYAKCNDINSATDVFWRTNNRNTVTWNTLIAGYINSRLEHEAFNLFDRMLKEGVEPSPVTYMILIPACGETGALRLGREMYGYLLKNQFDESDDYLARPLINMYDNSGREAKQNLMSYLNFIDKWNGLHQISFELLRIERFDLAAPSFPLFSIEKK
uniref:Pentatricopeptide repeat-containing protein n=1 Tax=Chenopodium quinoa TaxID=63459 RepID=A0A803MQA9_CHEQI